MGLKDPDEYRFVVTIDVPRLDDFNVEFDEISDADKYIEFMKSIDVRGNWKLWLTDEMEGTSDLRWG